MPHPKRQRYCTVCGQAESPSFRLSRHGKCAACGEALVVESLQSLRAKTGPIYEKWLERVRCSILRYQGEGAVRILSDDVPPRST